MFFFILSRSRLFQKTFRRGRSSSKKKPFIHVSNRIKFVKRLPRCQALLADLLNLLHHFPSPLEGVWLIFVLCRSDGAYVTFVVVSKARFLERYAMIASNSGI